MTRVVAARKRPAQKRARARKKAAAPKPAAASLHTLHTASRQRSTSTPRGTATAHFGELHGPLLSFLAGSPVIVGCVAWVTHRQILETLAQRPVALVIQKEDWWKKADARGEALARRYGALTGDIPARALPAPLSRRSKSVLAPIACIGYAGTKGGAGGFTPLMHHKFVVRCQVGADGRLEPLAVWTGSLNFTGNANDGFENAVEIHDPAIAGAYLEEFALVASVSEPISWRYGKPKGMQPAGPVGPTAKKTAKKGAPKAVPARPKCAAA